MKAVRALIYLPGVSKSCPRVKEFRRAPDFDNLLCFHGRPLEVDEFNKLAPKVINELSKANYGLLPAVKLVEIDLPDPEPEPEGEGNKGKANNQIPTPSSLPAALPENVEVEEIDGGFVLVDYRAGAPLYRGGESGDWLEDISLVLPFDSADAASASWTDPVGATELSQTSTPAESASPQEVVTDELPEEPDSDTPAPAKKAAKKRAKASPTAGAEDAT